MELALKISSKSVMAAGYTKRSINCSLNVGESAALDHERSLFLGILNTYDKTEGTQAFIQKRKPDFKNK